MTIKKPMMPDAHRRKKGLTHVVVISVGSGLLFSPPDTFAKEKIDKELSKQIAQIETTVVGSAPGHESPEQRLDAIETKLFGAPQTGILFDRLSRIRAKIATASSATTGADSSESWPAFPSLAQTASSASALNPQQTTATAEATAINPGPASFLAATSPGTTNSITVNQSAEPTVIPSAMTGGQSASGGHTAVTVQSPLKSEEESAPDGWPTALPRVMVTSTHRKGPLLAGVTETAKAAEVAFNALKNSSDTEAYARANEAMVNNNYKLAIKLYNMLSERKPKNPRYFYGSGMAYKADGDYENAFPDLILSWHLGNAKVYDDAVNSLIPVMKTEIDDTFKVTFDHSATEPEAVLNAGVRMWKSGLNSQSVKMFEYVLKNEPLYRGTAAYDLGATAEHNGNIKLALEYYKWAANENRKLEASAQKSPMYAGAIKKSLNALPQGYIERAVSDTQQKLLHGNTGWNGWNQAVSRPQHWGSEVCPLCGISRTSTDYVGGQMEVR